MREFEYDRNVQFNFENLQCLDYKVYVQLYID